MINAVFPKKKRSCRKNQQFLLGVTEKITVMWKHVRGSIASQSFVRKGEMKFNIFFVPIASAGASLINTSEGD